MPATRTARCGPARLAPQGNTARTRFRKSTNAGRVFSILGKKNEKEGSKSPVRPGARTPPAARIGKFPPPPGPARTALGALAGTPGHVPALSGYRSHRPIRGHAPTALYRQVGMGEMSSDPRPCAGPDAEAGGARPARDRPDRKSTRLD